MKVNLADPSRFTFVETLADGVSLYTAVVWSVRLKRPIRLAYLRKEQDGRQSDVVLFSTNIDLDPLQLYRCYAARFHIEFIFRDARQFTGLADCQARSPQALDSHVNAQLSNLLGAIQPTPANPDALVFPSRESQFIDWHNFTNRAWAKVMASLPEIEYRNPYQTRHTFCSLCREADIPSIQIAKWVGNSAQMIDRIYAKPTDHIQVPEL